MKNLLIAALVAPLLLAGPALAEKMPKCASWDEQVSSLKNNFGEVPISFGVFEGSMSGHVMFSNPETGTWSALKLFMKDGKKRGCFLALGTGFRLYTAPKKVEQHDPI